MPACGEGGAQQLAEKAGEILFSPGVSDHAFDPAGGDIEGGNQGLSAMPPVFELSPLDLTRQHRQARRDALERLNAGHLVHRDRAVSVVGASGGLVDLADIGALGVEGGIRLRRQPVAYAMRLEVGFFFKNRPTERCEISPTMPRRTASSAISRWLHWLIGRSLSDGFSHVIETMAQICSDVKMAGAPERGASASRSGADCPSAACRHRSANTVLSSAIRPSPARWRARPHRPQPAGSSGRATPTAAGWNGYAPAVPEPRAARPKRLQDRQLIVAWSPPPTAPDSPCHNTG
jgi:hypothetical protein